MIRGYIQVDPKMIPSGITIWKPSLLNPEFRSSLGSATGIGIPSWTDLPWSSSKNECISILSPCQLWWLAGVSPFLWVGNGMSFFKIPKLGTLSLDWLWESFNSSHISRILFPPQAATATSQPSTTPLQDDWMVLEVLEDCWYSMVPAGPSTWNESKITIRKEPGNPVLISKKKTKTKAHLTRLKHIRYDLNRFRLKSWLKILRNNKLWRETVSKKCFRVVRRWVIHGNCFPPTGVSEVIQDLWLVITSTSLFPTWYISPVQAKCTQIWVT